MISWRLSWSRKPEIEERYTPSRPPRYHLRRLRSVYLSSISGFRLQESLQDIIFEAYEVYTFPQFQDFGSKRASKISSSRPTKCIPFLNFRISAPREPPRYHLRGLRSV